MLISDNSLPCTLHPSIHPSLYPPAVKPCNPCVCPIGERSCQQPPPPPPPLPSSGCPLRADKGEAVRASDPAESLRVAARLTSDNSKLHLRFGFQPLNNLKAQDRCSGLQTGQVNSRTLVARLVRWSGGAGAHMAQKTRSSRSRQSRL